MEFRYRYVNYGCKFKPFEGVRDRASLPRFDDVDDQSSLFENELAVDIGADYWGLPGAVPRVIDHHFLRPDGVTQFPAAAAAVMHSALRIWRHFRSDRNYDTVWLVSHRDPDFDAFCSMYLARTVIGGAAPPPDPAHSGMHPDGWLGSERKPKQGLFDWYGPHTAWLPPETRWKVLLASVAAHADNGVRYPCPRRRALPSILYAAVKRQRPYGGVASGAIEFFDAVRDAIEDKALNPLFDSVLEDNANFAPELLLLDREAEAYQRDLRRAAKIVVTVSERTGDFTPFHDSVTRQPLSLDTPRPGLEVASQVDGIFLRDPESLLFKEWARADRENSPGGEGFLFTAVAYSNGRAAGVSNRSDYYFSLDPERAGQKHLYDVWELLQRAEIGAIESETPEAALLRRTIAAQEDLAQQEYEACRRLAAGGDSTAAVRLQERKVRDTCCRKGFEERGGNRKALFDDPWFDGANYRFTIVPTPGRGTLIGPEGRRSDLSDDEVAKLVRRHLEFRVYGSRNVEDWPALDGASPRSFESDKPLSAPSTGCLRFAVQELRGIQAFTNLALARQIGRELWKMLQPECDGVPDDFESRHLVIAEHSIAVWNRRGIAVAHPEGRPQTTARMKCAFEEMTALSLRVDEILKRARETTDPKREAGQAESLLLDFAKFHRTLDSGPVVPLRRMFHATEMETALQTVRDVHSTAVERAQRDAAHDGQRALEYVEILVVALYATELAHIILDLLSKGEEAIARKISLVALGFVLLSSTALLIPWKGRTKLVRRVLLFMIPAVLGAALLLAYLRPQWIADWLH